MIEVGEKDNRGNTKMPEIGLIVYRGQKDQEQACITIKKYHGYDLLVGNAACMSGCQKYWSSMKTLQDNNRALNHKSLSHTSLCACDHIYAHAQMYIMFTLCIP